MNSYRSRFVVASCFLVILVILPGISFAEEWDKTSIPAGSLSGLTFNPIDTTEVVGFHAVEGCGYRSFDGGKHWHKAEELPGPLYLIPKYFFHPTSPDTQMFITLQRFMFSSDGGATWENRTPSGSRYPLDIVDICHSQPNHISVSASNSHSRRSAWLTDNAGETWEEIDTDLSIYNVRHDPFDPSHLFGEGSNGLMHSDDGGNTWEPYLTNFEEYRDMPIADYEVSPVYQGTIYVIYEDFESPETPGDLYCLTTRTASPYDAVLSANQMDVDVAGNVVATAYSAAADMEYVFVSSDNCATWDMPGDWLPATGHNGPSMSRYKTLAINPLNPNTVLLSNLSNLFISYQRGYSCDVLARGIGMASIERIYIHTSGPFIQTGSEQLWRAPNFSVPEFPVLFDFIQDMGFQTNGANTVFASGMGLFKSTNGGLFFNQEMSAIYPGSCPSVTCFPSTPDTILAWHLEGLIRSDNGGEDWIQLPGTGLVQPLYSELYADRTHRGRVYTYGSGLLRSDDYGETWSRLASFTAPPKQIFQNPGQEDVMMLLEDGRFGYYDVSGNRFVDISPYGDYGEVLAVTPSPQSEHTYDYIISTEQSLMMRYSTGFYGVIERPFAGRITALAFSIDGDTLFLGTSDNGLWSHTGLFTAVEEVSSSAKPTQITLHPGYPNPFNATTRIGFDLPQAGSVRLSVYDLLGRRVTMLADGLHSAGHHEVNWNTNSSSGIPISSGTYLVRLESAGVEQVRKVQLVK